MIKQEDVYQIGRIAKPHGVRGEVSFLFDDDVFDRVDAEYLILELDGILIPFFMEQYRFRGESSALVKFCDIDTQEQASELTGCNVFFPREHASADDEVISKAAIIGFQIIDSETSDNIGTISGVDDSTPNILFNVTQADGKVILVPASADLIDHIDPKTKEIRMHLPDGILDL